MSPDNGIEQSWISVQLHSCFICGIRENFVFCTFVFWSGQKLGAYAHRNSSDCEFGETRSFENQNKFYECEELNILSWLALQQTQPRRYSDALPDCWGLSWRSMAKWRGQPASTPGQRLRQMDTSHPTCRWVQLCVDTNTVQRGGPVSFPSRMLWGLWVEKLHWDVLSPLNTSVFPCPYDFASALYFVALVY
jgi:hypothetical protein